MGYKFFNLQPEEVGGRKLKKETCVIVAVKHFFVHFKRAKWRRTKPKNRQSAQQLTPLFKSRLNGGNFSPLPLRSETIAGHTIWIIRVSVKGS